MNEFESVHSARESCARAIEAYLRDEISHFALEERIEEIGGACEGEAQDFFLALAFAIDHLGCDFHHSDWRSGVRRKRAEEFERICLFLRSDLPFEVAYASHDHRAGTMGFLLAGSVGVIVAWILVPPTTSSWKAFAIASFSLAWSGVLLWDMLADWLFSGNDAAYSPFASVEQYQEYCCQSRTDSGGRAGD